MEEGEGEWPQYKRDIKSRKGRHGEREVVSRGASGERPSRPEVVQMGRDMQPHVSASVRLHVRTPLLVLRCSLRRISIRCLIWARSFRDAVGRCGSHLPPARMAAEIGCVASPLSARSGRPAAPPT